MNDNIAALDGYTKELWAECDTAAFAILVRPGTDLDGTFKAWDMESQEFIRVNGWLWTFQEPAWWDEGAELTLLEH